MKRFFTKRIIIWIIAVVVLGLIGFGIFRPKAQTFKETYTVSKQDVRQTVIATGTVTSQSNLNLAFKSSGIVSRINVKVGDKVRSGQVLATLSQNDAAASLMTAQAAVESAQVGLNNAKISYANTKQQQEVLVSNALSTMLNTGLAANASLSNTSTATISVTGTYTGPQGLDTINVYMGGDGYHFTVSGNDAASGLMIRGTPVGIGSHGLYLTFSSSGNFASNDTWTISVPNQQASGYLAAYNSYQTALQTQGQQVATAQGVIDAAQAAVDSAKAQVLVADNTFANNEIIAPISGQITSVDIKLGEQATALKEAVVLLDQNSLHVESDIPESSIGLVKPGLSVDMTLDALGPDKHLPGEVESIDPASTVVSGVIDFRVVSSLPQDPQIKPGMTVNLSVVISDKPDAVAVPNRLLSSNGDKKYASVNKNGKVSNVEVQIGLAGDSYTEILSGLSVGDTVVSVSK